MAVRPASSETSVDHVPLAPGGAAAREATDGPSGPEKRDVEGNPVVLEVRGVDKSFRIPSQRIDSLKERVIHPFGQPDYNTMSVLRDISLDVRQGEFFGIVGRNGSGKSTLLKILASIYRADAGTVRIAGRLAPFIELGVGFNPDLTARENVVLNGVMMGLTQREAASRLDAVLEFAELEEFVDLRLKNYSSGMMVRLAFSVMVQADADILLIDEVLAVGDAKFQQKCTDYFVALRDGPKTVVLVTHDMASIREFCDRALLIDDGEIRFLGDPEEVGRRYLKLNFETADETAKRVEGGGADDGAFLPSAWIEDSGGTPISKLAAKEPIRFRVEVEAIKDIPEPSFGFVVATTDGMRICGFGTHLERDGEMVDMLAAGERARISADIENPLTPGRYVIGFWVCRHRNVNDTVFLTERAVEFNVYGSVWTPGIVSVDAEIEAAPAPTLMAETEA